MLCCGCPYFYADIVRSDRDIYSFTMWKKKTSYGEYQAHRSLCKELSPPDRCFPNTVLNFHNHSFLSGTLAAREPEKTDLWHRGDDLKKFLLEYACTWCKHIPFQSIFRWLEGKSKPLGGLANLERYSRVRRACAGHRPRAGRDVHFINRKISHQRRMYFCR